MKPLLRLCEKKFNLQSMLRRVFLSLLLLSHADMTTAFSEDDLLNESMTYNVPRFDNQQLIVQSLEDYRKKQNAENAVIKPVMKFAEAHHTSISPETWHFVLSQNRANADRYQATWRAVITSEGALSLNLGFARYVMPNGGTLRLYDPHQQQVFLFTEADNMRHKQLWTPLIRGDTIIIELSVPERSLEQLELELTHINHGFRDQLLDTHLSSESHHIDNKEHTANNITKALNACYVDVACTEPDVLQNQIRSVARLVISGQFVCSGVAINNTNFDNRPYLLTAAHCNINEESAKQILAYWNYNNSTCRDINSAELNDNTGDGLLNNVSQGTVLRALDSTLDMALIEFSQPFNPVYNIYLAGWDRGDFESSSSYSIHHPGGREKRISRSFNFSSIDNTYHRIVWSSGSTADGSSGAPLFNEQNRIIGQLFGGTATCENDGFDLFSRLDLSWSGGGTETTSLSPWLDPTNTGALSIDGKDANTPIGGTVETPTNRSDDVATRSGGGGSMYILLLLFLPIVPYSIRLTH